MVKFVDVIREIIEAEIKSKELSKADSNKE
jgi:hypothetical protein